MKDLKKLKLVADGFSILYAEDNNALRENAGKLLKKFFHQVDLAADGEEGLKKFKQHHYPIVITDIKMPKMDGMELSSAIKKLCPETKVIIMSAFDDKEYLYKGIELGVFRFLKKPVNLSELTDILYSAVLEIKHERNAKLFHLHLKSIFNYQSSMVMMLHQSKPVLANQMFLDFFVMENIEEFRENIDDLGENFMAHDGFLYNHGEINWFEVLELNEKKLFHIKMKNQEGEIRHFILKYQLIPEKKEYGILSFDDVTELNLLKLFDEKQTKNDKKQSDSKAMFSLLKVIAENSAKIEIHDYYKGLSITHDAIISEVKEDSIVIKTTYLQQKAIQFEGKTLIVSDALPHPIYCDEVLKIGFEKQIVELKSLRFTSTSPITRKTIRVVPQNQEQVSLFLGENKFHGDVLIEDISLDAVRLKLNALPAGLDVGHEVVLDIVLELDKRPLIINTKAILFRKSESRYSFSLVFMFSSAKNENLHKYMTSRQMAIIREFKGLQNG